MADDGIRVTIQGLQEAQAANQQMLAAVSENGARGRAVRGATLDAQRYAISITHVGRYWRGRRWIGGGTLRASHRVQAQGGRGMVYIDPDAVNPLTHQQPSVYGIYEHRRGYPHNFYERTIDERGDRIAADALNEIRSALP